MCHNEVMATITPVITISRRVGHTLKRLRNQNHLTQEQLAQKSGVERTTISKIESGKRMVYLEKLNILASTLGKHISELFK